MKKLVLHVVLNSHLDPIWLWGLQQGVDAVLATARTACDILDAYPEVHLTRGESWFYQVVQKHDPATFGRMRRFVTDGRLHIVGGWHVQPDCNLASPETYRRHGEYGCAYFREMFGAEVKTGYNVDSFGHGAYLPDFYASAGIRNYIMMRPQPHEKALPREVFRWRSPSGAELLAARIPIQYNTLPIGLGDVMDRVVAQADRALGHALFFCGVGDHGGGPARAEIEYLLEHRFDRPDVEVRFSHPDAFFDAVREDADIASLPVVEGELQHHAIGCYTAYSPIKRAVRQTENVLWRSAALLPRKDRERHARELLFATFHDVLAGTCIASAYPEILARLGAARTAIGEAELAAVQRKNRCLPPDVRQQIAIDNFGGEAYVGLAEFEPWILFGPSGNRADAFSLEEKDGTPIPFQVLPVESQVCGRLRLAFPVRIRARGRKIVYLRLDSPARAAKIRGRKSTFSPDFSFDVIHDATDTWSHRANSYPAQCDHSLVAAGPAVRLLDGPLVAEDLLRFRDAEGNSADLVIRREAGLRGVRLLLRLNWVTPREIVKLSLRPGFAVRERIDGVPGGPLPRKADGEEYPVFNFCRLVGVNHEIAVVSADVFGADLQPDGTLRLTLLRTPFFAHHDPCVIPAACTGRVTDIGEHFYDIVVFDNPGDGDVAHEVFRQTRPLRFSETTLGMADAALADFGNGGR